MTKEERRYQIERAKDNTPSTSLFVWFIPAFLFLAWMCREDIYVAPPNHAALVIFGMEIL